VTFFRGDHRIEETGGDYGGEGFILQEAATLPCFDGNYPICGVWIVAHEACGLGIREDRSRITGNGSRFIPHFFWTVVHHRSDEGESSSGHSKQNFSL
jgi:glutathionylspermidine synthase